MQPSNYVFILRDPYNVEIKIPKLKLVTLQSRINKTLTLTVEATV